MPFSEKTTIFFSPSKIAFLARIFAHEDAASPSGTHLLREIFGVFPPDFREDLTNEDAPWNFPTFLLHRTQVHPGRMASFPVP